MVARLAARVLWLKSKRILNHYHGEADNGLSLRGSHFLLLIVELLRAVEGIISGRVLMVAMQYQKLLELI